MLQGPADADEHGAWWGCLCVQRSKVRAYPAVGFGVWGFKTLVSPGRGPAQVRDWIVPVNRRYPLSQLMGLLRQLFPLSPQHTTQQQDSRSERDRADAGVQPQAGQEQGQGAVADHEPEAFCSSSSDGISSSTMDASHSHMQAVMKPQDGPGSSHPTASDSSSSHGSINGSSAGSSGTPDHVAPTLATAAPTPPAFDPATGLPTSLTPSSHTPRVAPSQHSTLLIEYTMLRGINDTQVRTGRSPSQNRRDAAHIRDISVGNLHRHAPCWSA